MTTLDYVRSYVARGWSVVPLVPGTKRPAIELRPFLTGERWLTWPECEDWWGGEMTGVPAPGVAIICGGPSGGLVVVDVDPRNGGDCEAVKRDCPTGYVVRTGGGGLHLYTQGPLGHVPKGKTIRPGVDRQADGGYVVSPPSVHPDTGRPYEIEEGGELLACPAWALEGPSTRTLSGGETAVPWVHSTLSAPESVRPGTQEETLTRLAWWAAGSLDRDIAEAALGLWIKGLTLGNPHLPWTSGHVRQKLDAAYEKRVPSFVVQGTSSRTVPETTDEESVATIQASIVSAASYEVARRDDWIVEHIAAPGCWTEVVGEVKKGKTTFNAQMIRSVLEGKPFLTWKVRQTGVVLYTEQVGLSLDATLERAGVRRHPNLYVLDQSKTFGKPWTHVACALIRRCEEVGAQLLFVDTLTRLAGVGGEGENFSGVVSILDPFREAKARGVACVFVRHAGKSRENREDASRAGRGSTALTGDMDIAVNLFQPGSEDVRRVKTISRLGEEITVLLRYDGSGYEAVEGGEVPVSGRERKATEMRDKVDTEFRSGNTTAAGVAKALGVDRKTAAKYIAELTGGFVVAGEGSDG